MLAKFHTGTMDSRVGIFLLTLNINDRLFFSRHTITHWFYEITSSLFEESEVNERNKTFQQSQTLLVPK